MSSADFVLYEEEFKHLEEALRRLPFAGLKRAARLAVQALQKGPHAEK